MEINEEMIEKILHTFELNFFWHLVSLPETKGNWEGFIFMALFFFLSGLEFHQCYAGKIESIS